jgi:hypothetical protein
MKHRPLSDAEFDQPWYKYTWSSEIDSESTLPYSLKNLRDNSLFFQSPKNFNDPYDSKVIIDPCTNEEWEAALRKIIAEDHEPQHIQDHEFNRQKAAGNPERALGKYRGIINGAKDSYGMFCLTPNPLDILMWAYYGEKHSGLCYQIDVKLCWNTLWDKNIITNIGHVNYVPAIPKIDFVKSWLNEEENSELRQAQEITFCKWDKWETEAEIRIAIAEIERQAGSRLLKFPEGIYRSVILGINTKPEMIVQVKTILRGKEIQIPLYRISPKEDQYLLELKRVDY